MNLVDYYPILVTSHRQYLRELFHPVPTSVAVPGRRERLGALIVRFGEWVGNRRTGGITDSPERLLPARPELSKL